MKRYKLVGFNYHWYERGKIYDEDFVPKGLVSGVKDLVQVFPKDWEEVKEEFSLPEIWCVEVHNNDQFHSVRKYLAKLPGCKFGENHPAGHNPFYKNSPKNYFIGMYDTNGFFYNQIYHKESHASIITFEQFEKYIKYGKRNYWL